MLIAKLVEAVRYSYNIYCLCFQHMKGNDEMHSGWSLETLYIDFVLFEMFVCLLCIIKNEIVRC